MNLNLQIKKNKTNENFYIELILEIQYNQYLLSIIFYILECFLLD